MNEKYFWSSFEYKGKIVQHVLHIEIAVPASTLKFHFLLRSDKCVCAVFSLALTGLRQYFVIPLNGIYFFHFSLSGIKHRTNRKLCVSSVSCSSGFAKCKMFPSTNYKRLKYDASHSAPYNEWFQRDEQRWTKKRQKQHRSEDVER